MNVLIACEESQEVCKAFRERSLAIFKNVPVGARNGISRATFSRSSTETARSRRWTRTHTNKWVIGI